MSMRLNPYRSQTLAIKADALLRTGQSQQAIDAAKEALKHNPSLIEVHQWLRDTYKKLDRIQESDAERTTVEQMMRARPPVSGR
jgi:predicted Zn-dependent protease